MICLITNFLFLKSLIYSSFTIHVYTTKCRVRSSKPQCRVGLVILKTCNHLFCIALINLLKFIMDYSVLKYTAISSSSECEVRFKANILCCYCVSMKVRVLFLNTLFTAISFDAFSHTHIPDFKSPIRSC